MTKIKLCGLTRQCDIDTANQLSPEYIGFVFAPKSRRYVSPEAAAALRRQLSTNILPVGVFVNEHPEVIASLLTKKTIAIAQLHGTEDETYIQTLRSLTDAPIIKAFSIASVSDIKKASACTADYVLLDSGNGGTGTEFNRALLQHITRPYFLAGGLTPENIRQIVVTHHPYAVDVSSGIETNGHKDSTKMSIFVDHVHNASNTKI